MYTVLMKHTIKLYRGHDSWMARFSDPRVLRLFGTPEIPTPFTLAASAEFVLAAIAQRNPDYLVKLA